MTKLVRVYLHGAPIFCRGVVESTLAGVAELVELDDQPEVVFCHWNTPLLAFPRSVQAVGTNMSRAPWAGQVPSHIAVYTTPELPRVMMDGIKSVREVAIGLMLEGHRSMAKAAVFQTMNTKGWNNRDNFVAPFSLVGKTALIVGAGRIGRSLIGVLQGFDMRIEVSETNSATWALLPAADMVFLCCTSPGPDGAPIFDASHLIKMKTTAGLIDVTQPGTLDWDDAIDALVADEIRFLATDVAPEGWLTGDAIGLAQSGRLIATPHIGGSTADARAKTEMGVIHLMVAAMVKEKRRNG